MTLPLNRRQLLHSTLATGLAGLGAGLLPAQRATATRSCILINLVGAPSQLETFDPKPGAPSDIRGPFGVIRTSVPGVILSEHLPKIAKIMHKLCLIRSLYHEEAPIHETGLQLIQTGVSCSPGFSRFGSAMRDSSPAPHIGTVITSKLGGQSVMLPFPIGRLGVSIGNGQSGGPLARYYHPRFHASAQQPSFLSSCLEAVRLVEQGTRFITINMFDTVYDNISWDCHADGGSLRTTLDDYRTILCPMLDEGYSRLILGLEERGLLDSTLVVASGEFGRSSRLNYRGGRDHSTSCWSALLAGAGTPAGAVLGKSDRNGHEPVDQPMHASELYTRMLTGFGLFREPGMV